MVIITSDFNEDIQADNLRFFFSKLGMSAVHSTLHGAQLPVTHNRGTLPIDGIFIPDALIPMCRAGYLAFGEGVPSDHCAVWMDIPLALLHMCQDNSLVKNPVRHLQCTDPRVVLRYNTLLHECLTEANAFL